MPKVVRFSKHVRTDGGFREIWNQWLVPSQVMKENGLRIGDTFDLEISSGKINISRTNCYIGQRNFFFIGVIAAERLKAACATQKLKDFEFAATFPDRIIEPQISKKEGDRILRHIRALERDLTLAKKVKEKNRLSNKGVLKCEACCLTDSRSRMFDAHHLEPLCTGPRQSQITSFALLCPTCHRWAHVSGIDRYHPLPVAAIREARRNGS